MQRLVLVGSGLSHLLMMNKMQIHKFPNTQVTLISPSRYQYYSGMFSGYIEGTYQLDEIRVDLEHLAKQANMTWLADSVVRLDTQRREVYTANGQVLTYEMCSVNLGSTSAQTHIPGVSEHATMLKPSYAFEQVMELTWCEKAVAIVGGGPSGVEFALSLQARRKRLGVNAPLYLITKSDILPQVKSKHAEKVAQVIRKSGITLITQEAVLSIVAENEGSSEDKNTANKRLVLSSGRNLDVGHVIWLTGSSAWPLFKESDFSIDHQGYVLTDSTLQTVSDKRVFAVGDCRTMVDFPDLHRTGVFAVREFPILWSNLQHVLCPLHVNEELASQVLHRYQPQKHYVSILNAGNHRGILFYRGWMFTGWWCWLLKKWIDTRFMKKIRS